MKRILRGLSLLLALLMTLSVAAANADAEQAIALVNGEPLLISEYTSIESAYLYQYEAAGVDLTDPTMYAYVTDLALTYAIEQMLVVQDMKAQGCFELDEETEAWCVEQGTAAYEQALKDVGEMLRETLELAADMDMSEYALSYAASLNVTVDTYIDVYRTQYASAKYSEWLIRDNPVTDADVQDAYNAAVEESRALYAGDIAAFENAINSGKSVWYKPAGYRSILQILLPAEGATEAEKLASVQTTVDEINNRLGNGESFQSLIAEYGKDAAFDNEAFMSTGYQVHRESVIWETTFVSAAFSEAMAAPGSWSQPFASELGVHILYYLCDSAEGPAELTEEVSDALSYVIYTERTQAAQRERINELVKNAEIAIY